MYWYCFGCIENVSSFSNPVTHAPVAWLLILPMFINGCLGIFNTFIFQALLDNTRDTCSVIVFGTTNTDVHVGYSKCCFMHGLVAKKTFSCGIGY